ncbi:MAG: AAA family ATPase [Parabacteroides sp.]|nr:AAA family ATPase [bacterium]MDY4101832.1 AAA family ATPase [Parabacteroides sp.]
MESNVLAMVDQNVLQLQNNEGIEDALLKIIEQSRLSVEKVYAEEVNVLLIGNQGCFSKGNLHAIKAKPKHGKTTAIYLMCVALLKEDGWGALSAAIKKPKIIIFDTEQAERDAQEKYITALEMAGLPKKDDFERLEIYPLRAQTMQEKRDTIEHVIKVKQPDIVFIDGIVDLLADFNDVKASQELIERLMQLSTKEVVGKDVAIVCVLHTNKNSEDNNMRGHLGTMLQQKASSTFMVTKSNGIFTVTNTESRHGEVSSWSFCYDDDNNIVDATANVAELQALQKQKKQEEKQKKSEATKQQRSDKLLQIVREHGNSIQRSELKDLLMNALVLKRSSVDNLINKCVKEQRIQITNEMVMVPSMANPTTTNALFGNC